MAKAQKGDLIRIVKEKQYQSKLTEDFVLGAIYEVDSIDEDGDVNFIDGLGDMRYLSDTSMYVVHRKAGEEDAPVVCAVEATCDAKPFDLAEECRTQPFQGLVHHDTFPWEEESDAVSHPNHYTQGRFETIEIIEEITQGYSDGYVAYCVGNALKYLARAPFKHGDPTEDIAKSAKYIEFALNRLHSTQN